MQLGVGAERQLAASSGGCGRGMLRFECNKREGGDPMISGISKLAMALLDRADVGATSSDS
jgi:hypothetical protein